MQHANFVFHCSRSQSRGVPVHNDRRLIMMSISLNCYENPSDRTPLSVGEQRDSMVSCLGPEGFIRGLGARCGSRLPSWVWQISWLAQTVHQNQKRWFKLFFVCFITEQVFTFYMLFFFSKCDHEEKCPREKVLSKFLHRFFGSSETSFGTFGLEFEDDVIVLPVFQFTVAKDFYVIYFIQIKSCCKLSTFFPCPFSVL